MSKPKKKKRQKLRNPFAVPARHRNGAGLHKDRKKEADKNACRKKDEDDS